MIYNIYVDYESKHNKCYACKKSIFKKNILVKNKNKFCLNCAKLYISSEIHRLKQNLSILYETKDVIDCSE